MGGPGKICRMSLRGTIHPVSQHTIVWILVAVSAGTLAFAAGPEKAPSCREADPPCGWLRGPRHEDLFLISAGRTSQTGSHHRRMRGFSLEATGWKEEDGRVPTAVAGGLWLAAAEDGVRERTSAGGSLTGLVGAGPLRIGLRASLGVIWRNRPSGDEFGFLEGAGLDLGLWLGRRVQVAALGEVELDRLNNRSGSRVSVILRTRVWSAPGPE